MSANAYPVQLTIDYPDRPLNRVSSAFRIFTVIPILIVLAALDGSNYSWDSHWGDTGSSSTQTADGRRRRAGGPGRPHDPVPPEVPALVVRLELQPHGFVNRVASLRPCS